ncbi:hypothetical protein AHAT_32420 [Agarivorans sp. Toyoura001]|uniref:hypothetical protein n=1 Tax=Agarivorans sp. Toyoura001 TaxID=2283141 RepID=UPI0010E1499C|nr:hypothetical protein [Agarivorans sp. Toyoura001]GDY27352.1 hypothetical protein AHAT_32420 [Agarivorans sp. Toyoura001]
MQQLTPLFEVLEEHGVIKLNHLFEEQQFLAQAQDFIEQQAWPISFAEQGADWLVLGFYLEQQLWWWRFDALTESAWFECANSEHFQASCTPLLAVLKHASFG